MIAGWWRHWTVCYVSADVIFARDWSSSGVAVPSLAYFEALLSLCDRLEVGRALVLDVLAVGFGVLGGVIHRGACLSGVECGEYVALMGIMECIRAISFLLHLEGMWYVEAKHPILFAMLHSQCLLT